MTDKQIIGGRGSAKSYTTLNTIEVMLENEKLKEALKRKEQECEELKAKCKKYGEINEQETKDYAELKTENDELKETLKTKAKGWANVNDKILEEVGQMADRMNCYKQTLAEIKELCNNNDELKGDFNLVDCDKYKLGKHNLANKILQKISEVGNG